MTEFFWQPEKKSSLSQVIHCLLPHTNSLLKLWDNLLKEEITGIALAVRLSVSTWSGHRTYQCRTTNPREEPDRLSIAHTRNLPDGIWGNAVLTDPKVMFSDVYVIYPDCSMGGIWWQISNRNDPAGTVLVPNYRRWLDMLMKLTYLAAIPFLTADK